MSAYKTDLFTATVIFLVGMGGFGLGRLSAVLPEKKEIRITNNESPEETSPDPTGQARSTNEEKGVTAASVRNESALLIKGKFVASKSGTAYHFPWCPGALKIKDENKIWFETKEEAEKKGYKPAGNCPGL
ncbi:MAG: hypothetical protein G01um101433_704 [Parcubacteria group bacterium Gr01-1014_33]|nr:MAG: hypothetical protein G01um101433_704 [Parcubacteria group bacterium Gr01-1014_33]